MRVYDYKWAYGVTTVPERRLDLLPITLKSLANAGFDKPRLFVDGGTPALLAEYQQLGLELTMRWPTIRTYANWALGLAELYYRDPVCHYYAMFQDDMVTYRNLRSYLNRCQYPDKGYWNLYTFPVNQTIAPEQGGWFLSNQMGKGAVALVFSREAVCTLMEHPHWVRRSMDTHRGWRTIDGGIVTAFAHSNWKEYCHSPSLVQHIGLKSTMGNGLHPQAISFRGEDYDALKLLEKLPPLENEPEPYRGILRLGENGEAERAIRSVDVNPYDVENWLGPCQTCNSFQDRLTKLGWWVNERLQGRSDKAGLLAIMEE